MTSPEPPTPTLGQLPNDQLIYRGNRVDLVLRNVPTHSGTTHQREVCLHPGAVIILPITDSGDIILINNRRHTVNQQLLELPAGTLERQPAGAPIGQGHEDPAQAAARELTEETGYTAQQIESFGWFYTSPGILTEKMYAFIARGLKQGPQALEDSEHIEVQPTSPRQVLQLILENRIVDAKTIATVLKYLAGTGFAPP